MYFSKDLTLKKFNICLIDRVVLVILFSWMCINTVFAQYDIKQYNHEDGMHLSRIDNIIQDSLGYIWIGGGNGLARFDGVKFKYFYQDSDNPDALPFSDISEMVCDPKGNVWIGSHEGGIAIYDEKKDGFSTFIADDESFLNRPLRPIWFQDENLAYCSFINRILTRLTFDETEIRIDTLQFTASLIQNIIQSPANNDELVVSTNKGIYTYDLLKDEMETIDKDHEWHSALLVGNTIYGGSYAEIVNTYDLDVGQITQLEGSYQKGWKRIAQVEEEIWVSDGKSRINRYDPNNALIDVLNLSNGGELVEESIHEIFQDLSGGIWIGRDRDILYLNQKKKGVASYTTFTDKYEVAFDAIALDEDRDLIATVYENHFLEYNDKTNDLKQIVSRDNLRGGFKIHVVGKDTLILCGFGVGKYDHRENSVSSYLKPEETSHFSGQWLVDGIKGLEDDLWVLGSKYRMMHLGSKGVKKVFDIYEKRHPDHFARVLMRYDDDILLIGGSRSIAVYSLSQGLLNTIVLKGTVFDNTINDMLLDVDDDGSKIIWITSFNPNVIKAKLVGNEIEILQTYNMKNALLNRPPSNILKTKEGAVVASSRFGLATYNKEEEKFERFNDDNSFLGVNIVNIKEVDDKIFVFQHEGITKVDKETLLEGESAPNIYIEKILVNSTHFPFQNLAETFHLENSQKNISIHYSALNFKSPHEIIYTYALNDGEWTELDYREKVIRFNQLQPGSYTFKIKAKFADSPWTDEKIVRFEIAPPFWQRWWFILLLAALLSIAVYLYIKWREQNFNKISNYEKRLIELESEALRAQMNPHFIFNSLNSIKAFIIRNEAESAADYLTLFAELIRVVLHNSKQKMLPLSDEIEAIDLYTQLENIRLNDKFELKWHIDENLDLRNIAIPPLTLQPFVENAIWHGFIHKKTKGTLDIHLHVQRQKLIAKIKDDGIGRVKSMEIEGRKSGSKKSYGIAITSQRLDQNKGEERIKIRDLYNEENEAIGTEVELTIDLIKINP